MTRNGWTIVLVALVACLGGCKRALEEPEQARAAQAPEAQAREPGAPETRIIRKVRDPAFAGMFYPEDKKELSEQIDRYLAEVKPEPIQKLRGLIAPHAGYRFSGPVAAVAYKQLEGRAVDTVIVLAPSHRALFEGASIPDVDAYQTPLGPVVLSPCADELVGVGPFVRNPPCKVARPDGLPSSADDTPHTWEHSLEVQLPFLQKTLKDFTIVPAVLGEVDPEKVADVLADYLDEKTILVASSDLSHFLPYETAKHLDSACIHAICELDVEFIDEEYACGWRPIVALMHLAKRKGWQAKLLDYRNSGDTAGDKSGVVGYAAIAFFEPDGGGPSAQAQAADLTPQEGKTLLALAEKAVHQVVRSGTLPTVDPGEMPQSLNERRACFVTLNKSGELRGCIGSIFPEEPLCQAVIRKARSAALEDPRFPGVTPEELDELEIEVSVLTVPKRLDFDSPEELVKKLRPHTDGVVLRMGRRQATYLPQVWEKIPDPESFLNHLAEKAGLYPSAWKDLDMTILTYQVQAFEQAEK